MRPPDFWQNKPDRPGFIAAILSPLAFIYASATAYRVQRAPAIKPDVPVICIGNLNISGTGKTPTVIALIELLSNRNVHVVTRGYGGSEVGPLHVNEKNHTADEVGDEPLLLAAFSTTCVSKDRAAGVRAAQNAGAEVILLDDGFQNPDVAKSLNLVVVDAARGFGNGKVIPAGPLRETIHAGLSRADLLLSIGNLEEQEKFDQLWGHQITVPRVRAETKPLQTGMDWQGQRVLAFAGIGQPEKFFQTLRSLGANIVKSVPLDDHQPLSDTLLNRLQADATALSAQLVTTEKDAVRLPTGYRRNVLALPVRLKFTQRSELDIQLNRLDLT